MEILKKCAGGILFANCLLMTAIVVGLYLGGLAFLIPILLPVVFYKSDSKFVSKLSKVNAGDAPDVDLQKKEFYNLTKKSVYRYIALFAIPALCFQGFCFFAINDYASRNSDFAQLVKHGPEFGQTWELYKLLESQTIESNDVLINEYKKLPVFGWREGLQGNGAASRTSINFPILSFFYLVNLVTALCGILVGCIFLLNSDYRNSLKKMYYLLEADSTYSRVDDFENKRATSFILVTTFLVLIYIALFNFSHLSLSEFFMVTLCALLVPVLPSYMGWALIGVIKRR